MTTLKKEYAVLVAALVFAFIPVAAGFLRSPEGYFFNGLISPLDGNTYASFYNQAKDGRLLFTNEYTPEKVPHAMFRPVYLLMGLSGGLLGLPYEAAYHAFRIIMIVLLFHAVTLLIKETTGRKERTIALVLVFFSSGVGYVLRMLELFGLKRIGTSDLWLPGGITFLSINGHPHLIASIAMMTYAAYWIVKALKNEGSKNSSHYLRNAAMVMLVLGFVHLFDDITLYAALAITVGASMIIKRTTIHQFIAKNKNLAWMLIPLIAFIYTAYLFIGIPEFSSWNAQNTLEAPKVYYFVFGYGLLWLFIAVGWAGRERIRHLVSDKATLFLASWVAATFILVYSPMNIQRRFIEGVHIPISILASYGLTRIRDAIALTSWKKTAGLAAGLLVLMTVPSNLLWLYHNTPDGTETEWEVPWRVPLYLKQTDIDAMKWFGSTKDAVVITDYGHGNYLPRYSHARPYVGHWAQTISFEERASKMEKFLNSKNTQEFTGMLEEIAAEAREASGGSSVYVLLEKNRIPEGHLITSKKYENKEIVIFTP
ncbi:hypothetical protein D6764_00170 [Candidatus Woesearchaeota archaeon]|nr:MAG: hypothetical protein D6764_00170 [Candidatus Woesearchaeota archaeon]